MICLAFLFYSQCCGHIIGTEGKESGLDLKKRTEDCKTKDHSDLTGTKVLGLILMPCMQNIIDFFNLVLALKTYMSEGDKYKLNYCNPNDLSGVLMQVKS